MNIFNCKQQLKLEIKNLYFLKNNKRIISSFLIFLVINIYAENSEIVNIANLRSATCNFIAPENKGSLNSIADCLGQALFVAEDVVYTLLAPVQEIIKQNMPAIYENPFRNMGASVRLGGPVGQQELIFRENRLTIVKAAQEKFLDQLLEDDDVLEIAISCSGGGWRAMCCAAGSCVGASKIGLFPCSMYVSSLSGSSWFLASWLSSQMSIYDYKKKLIDIAAKGLGVKNQKEAERFFDNMWVKLAFSQPINLIDIYGSFLANTLLVGMADDVNRIYITDQRKVIDSGNFPMPIYTAVLGEPEMEEHLFEFTPYEAGTRWLNAYIPSWAFGRHFKRGISKSNAPEQSLGFMMGLFGSAFAADFEDLYEIGFNALKFPEFLKDLPFAKELASSIKKVLGRLIYSTDIGDVRITWARIPNFVYKMDGIAHCDKRELQLVDAGLDLNNPVFSCYRRPQHASAPDIIFVFDAGTAIKFHELEMMASYAKRKGLKFPKIKEFDPLKKVISVFKDDNDPEVPTIVYMPRINGLNFIDRREYKNIDKYYLKLLDGFDMEKATSLEEGGFAATYNFKYDKNQAETLVAMTEFNIISVVKKIKKIMREKIELKRKFKRINSKK